MLALSVFLHIRPGGEERWAETTLVHLFVGVGHPQVALHVVFAREHFIALWTRETDSSRSLGNAIAHLLVPGEGRLVHERAVAPRTDVGHDDWLSVSSTVIVSLRFF